jgi:hypothetical protein
VIVNWNSGAHLKQCLQSISSGYQVVVVDNASTDNSVTQALESCDGARRECGLATGGAKTGDNCGLGNSTESAVWRLLRNGSNRGFAGAANDGASVATRDFLLFLNPDIRFADPQSPDAMLAALQRDPQAGAAAGKLKPLEETTPAVNREPANLIRPLPTLASAISDVLFVDEILRRRKPSSPTRGEIEQAPGACLMVRRSVFKALGGFDEAFYPAWFEDVDLCKRMRDRGLRILYEPGSVFYHLGGYSLQMMSPRRFHRIYYGNMVRYFKKHHGSAAAAILKTATLVGNLVRGVLN